MIYIDAIMTKCNSSSQLQIKKRKNNNKKGSVDVNIFLKLFLLDKIK